MYDGSRAVIKMVQNLKEGMELDKNVYSCTVIEYEKEKELLHVLLSSGVLAKISLDALYECKINTLTGEASCIGKIKERYENRAGMILALQVLNGFYERNLNEF